MASYNHFASVYDDLTENINYKVRSEYISNFFYSNGIKGGTLLDLACGTGSMGLFFLEKGFKVIGVDASEEMLSIADNKSNGKVTLINAKMQDFSLTEPANACMCNLDSINHLESLDDVKKTIKNVYNSLTENGIFVFDVNTIYKHKKVLADNTFVFDEENYFLSWDNELLDDRKVRIMLDLFVFNGNSYDRYAEEFTETAYSITELKGAIKPYFKVLGVYDELTLEKPKSSSERIYFVLKRK